MEPRQLTEDEKLRVKQILYRARKDIDQIFIKMEQELFAGSAPVPIFQKIEHYIARAFSPMEIQTIQEWLSKYQPDLIELALNEAATRNVRNIRYIDKILLNWENAGVKEPKEAIEMSAKFKRKAELQIPEHEQSERKVTFYNWLEERE